MKRIIVLSLLTLLATGYSSPSFAAGTNSDSSVTVGKTSTDYYRHHRRHCHRCWYGMDDAADNESFDAE